MPSFSLTISLSMLTYTIILIVITNHFFNRVVNPIVMSWITKRWPPSRQHCCCCTGNCDLTMENLASGSLETDEEQPSPLPSTSTRAEMTIRYPDGGDWRMVPVAPLVHAQGKDLGDSGRVDGQDGALEKGV